MRILPTTSYLLEMLHKGHTVTQCARPYDNRSEEVVRNYGALTLEKIGQVSTGDYFRLKQLVTLENSISRGYTQRIPRPNENPRNTASKPTIITQKSWEKPIQKGCLPNPITSDPGSKQIIT
eukprot:IDg12729t1